MRDNTTEWLNAAIKIPADGMEKWRFWALTYHHNVLEYYRSTVKSKGSTPLVHQLISNSADRGKAYKASRSSNFAIGTSADPSKLGLMSNEVQIDDIRAYERKLSEEEISKLANI